MVLFELLITIAIIGVLVALLIPAVRAARESKRDATAQTAPAKRLLVVGAGVTAAGLALIPLSGGQGGSAEGTGTLDTGFVPESTAQTTFDVEDATITMVFRDDGSVEWDSRVDIRVEEGGCVFGSASIREGTGRWTDGGAEADGTFRHRTRVDVREGPCDPTPERDLAGRDLQWELGVNLSAGAGDGTLHDVRPEGTGSLEIPFDIAIPATELERLGETSSPSRWFAGAVAGVGALGAGTGAALNWWRPEQWESAGS